MPRPERKPTSRSSTTNRKIHRPMPAAILSGILTALAFPKAGLSFLAWISLIPLLLVLTGKRRRSGFLTAGLAGFVVTGILLYWIPAVPAPHGGMAHLLCILLYLAP